MELLFPETTLHRSNIETYPYFSLNTIFYDSLKVLYKFSLKLLCLSKSVNLPLGINFLQILYVKKNIQLLSNMKKLLINLINNEVGIVCWTC